VCPTGALREQSSLKEVISAIQDPQRVVVVQHAPAVSVTLAEEFGVKAGADICGKMTAALRQVGFDRVFETSFSADLTIMEEASELVHRIRTGGRLPMLTSCSPGWIKFMEYYHPDMLANLSTCKSPQQMFGAMAKTYYAAKLGKRPEQIVVVSVMPCTAKKFECQRPEMDVSGARDVDIVLTTRELGKMIRAAGIDFNSLPDEEMDAPLGMSSGAADIFANTGGVMEAAIRTAYEIVTGRELPLAGLHVASIAGLNGVKEASLLIEGTKPEWKFLDGATLNVAVAHGLGNAQQVIAAIRSGQRQYHFVEVMTCPGGCIGGGGQPRYTNNQVRQARINAIYREDEGKTLRMSHENPDIARLYAEFLGQPLGEKSHHLLHTQYTPRERM
ncbi:MAG: [FeFe] hydrogenase, group A, partial [Planctomycetota bacterium]|nr:[FeFe] hydrogenase, group A [Planctomycetota bacterium]